MNFIIWLLEKLFKAGKRVSFMFCIVTFISLSYGLFATPFNTIIGAALWLFIMHHVYRKTQ